MVTDLGPSRIRAAAEVREEVSRWLPRLAAKRRLDPDLLLMALQVVPVGWAPRSTYAWLEGWARSRMAGRDEDDWPTVALARALALTIDSRRRPIMPRTWVRHLPEPLWQMAFAPSAVTGMTVAIWSQDKDFEVCGLPVVKTGQVLTALGR